MLVETVLRASLLYRGNDCGFKLIDECGDGGACLTEGSKDRREDDDQDHNKGTTDTPIDCEGFGVFGEAVDLSSGMDSHDLVSVATTEDKRDRWNGTKHRQPAI